MPRIVLKITEKQEEFVKFLQEKAEIESHIRMGSIFMVNFSSQEEDFVFFQQQVKENFSVLASRELCRAKCRDNSDCLNTAKVGNYCWRHRNVGEE